MRYILPLCLLLAACTGGTDNAMPAPANEVSQPPTRPADKPQSPARPATVSLEIEGMHCDTCALWVKDILEKLDGVAGAEVSYQKHSALVTLKPGATFPEAAARDELDKENYTLKPVASKPAD